MACVKLFYCMPNIAFSLSWTISYRSTDLFSLIIFGLISNLVIELIMSSLYLIIFNQILGIFIPSHSNLLF